jgi:hypothetical protein
MPYATPIINTTIKAMIITVYHFTPEESSLFGNDTLMTACSEEYSLVAASLI